MLASFRRTSAVVREQYLLLAGCAFYVPVGEQEVCLFLPLLRSQASKFLRKRPEYRKVQRQRVCSRLLGFSDLRYDNLRKGKKAVRVLGRVLCLIAFIP